MANALTAPDSEREVVGTCLLRGSISDAATLVAESFSELPHRGAWEAMVSLTAKQLPIDPVTVAAEVRALGREEWFRAGGGVDDGLAAIAGNCFALGNLDHHAAVVAAKTERRRWVSTAREIAAMGMGDTDDAAFTQEAERLLLEMVSSKTEARNVRHVKSVMRRVVEMLGERVQQFKSGNVSGIPTGFTELDRLLGGLTGGRLYLLGARPAMGKSSLALNIAYRSKVPMLLFGLEMTAEENGIRLVAAEGRVDGRRLETGDFGDESGRMWSRIHEAIGRLVEAPMWFEDHSDLTITQMRSIARRWRSSACPGVPALVVVDYVQLVGGSGSGGRTGSREQEVSEVSRQLKAMAKELDAPVLALAQLNRELERREDKRPKLSDLRESGALEQDTNAVMFLYRGEEYCDACRMDEDCRADPPHKGVAEVIVAKNRHGPTGTMRLTWRPHHTSFENFSNRSDE